MARRRRRGGQDIKDFVQAFLQGYKIFNDADRSRSRTAKDDYSDDNLSRYDSRLGSQSTFSKMFGGNEGALEGPDRGRAVLDAKIKRAYELGDASKVEALAKERAKFEEQSRKYPFDDANKPAAESALPIGKRSDAGDLAAPGAQAATYNEPAIDQPPVQTAELEPEQMAPEPSYDTASAGSLFDDYGSSFDTPDMDTSMFAAHGGMVPAMHMATGGSATSLTGDTDAMVPALDVEQEPDVEEPPVQRSGNMGLSRDPEDLAREAAPAVTAGLDRIQSELSPNGAISDADPEYQRKLQAFAGGKGRMSDEDMKAIDGAIDPDGGLPSEVKSAARIAAVYKFYNDQGDPDTASTMAARLMLRDKFESQTRGAMAKHAFETGETESGVKLLEDAYNNNMPDGKRMLAEVRPDGSVKFRIGYERPDGFVPLQEGEASKEDLIKLASNTASSDTYMRSIMAIAGSEKKGGGKTGGKGGGKSNASTPDGALSDALDGLRGAAREVEKAEEGGDQKAIDEARAKLEKAESAARKVPLTGKNKDWSAEKRDELVNKAMGSIKPKSVREAVDSNYGYGPSVDKAVDAARAAQKAAEGAVVTKKKTGWFSSEDDPNSVASRDKAQQEYVDRYYDVRRALRKSGKDEDEIDAILHGSEKDKKRPKIPGLDAPSGAPTLRGAIPTSAAPAPAPAPTPSAIPVQQPARPVTPTPGAVPAQQPARPAQAAPPPPPAPAAGQPVKITSKDQFDQLPKGTKFVAPDGSVRIKP